MTGSIEILDPGVATTVQDAGRPGLAHIGVTTSGFVDPGLAGLVNRLIGNPATAALLETVGGLRIRSLRPVLVASSTEPAPKVLAVGEELTVRPDRLRQWHYLAVRGGIEVDAVLGSRSRDTLSGIGPAPVTEGDVYDVGPEPAGEITTDVAPVPELGDVVRISPGPRADWFDEGWMDTLTSAEWTVATSSRVGLRLRGPAIRRRITDELPSEGLVRGAVQVPPDGQPVVMLADHPTTGGYPVIAVVHPADVAVAAQHLGGRSIRFHR